MRVVNCLKYLKNKMGVGWGGREKGRGETKILKRAGGELGQGVGALKRMEGRGWNLIANYAHFSPMIF